MALAFTLGFVMSNVILTLFFFLCRHADRIAGSFIPKRFPRAKMGQTGGELLDSVPRRETKTAESYERQF